MQMFGPIVLRELGPSLWVQTQHFMERVVVV